MIAKVQKKPYSVFFFIWLLVLISLKAFDYFFDIVIDKARFNHVFFFFIFLWISFQMYENFHKKDYPSFREKFFLWSFISIGIMMYILQLY